ncbi:MAG: helix-turn-helix domain-containing protein [Paracoccaceae bacterium]|uniref:helix-turn-helix domain-containing protein n=1 Tax=Candidatus Salinivivens marinus TaxID=3381703 RepID=UPI000B6BB2C0|nr:MerR family transcriptional regulator [Marinovum sp.]OUU13009.1 MAG: MerR family transcriptional regulator [Rhodobacteraceae bacterium TMED38]PDH60767.1 MAG: MerR family transcriptional regulator [Rhodobacteraceae bacterium MED-G08]|tara:strand:- start:1310 stop:1951 length:642 start_codon:yes stop_codon:yes gene_type:complete
MPKVEINSVSKQNPHSLSEYRENVLEVAIGRQIRIYRKQMEITVSDLSKMTGLSTGMLSKIENGNTSPSLSTLQTLSNALSIPMTAFFKQFEQKRECIHTKANEGVEVEGEGTRAGHQYNLLGHLGSNDSGVIVEPYLIELTSETDTFKTFQHGGLETIYMLAGEITYRHGDGEYKLQPGDTLFFDANTPHGPVTLDKLPARFLSIISYPLDK